MKLGIRFFMAMALSVFCVQSANAAVTPDLVLVHGANMSPESWSWVQTDLASLGVRSFTAHLYKSNEKVNLAEVSNRLCGKLAQFKKRVVLMGHSQGGAIITQTAGTCPQFVRGLVYVAAVYPRSGEGVFDDLSQQDNDSYAQCGQLNETTGTYVLKGMSACRSVFFADAPLNLSPTFFRLMRPDPAGIGDSHANYPAGNLKRIPKYYIATKFDSIISPDTQTKIAAKDHFVVLKIGATHTPFFMKHRELSVFLQKIAASLATK